MTQADGSTFVPSDGDALIAQDLGAGSGMMTRYDALVS